MKNHGLTLSFSLLALILASFALSCGTNSQSQGQGQLQSITLSPGTAEGEAQFVATGHYINPSYTVTPQPANWVACQQNTPTTEVSVSNKGAAQCASGATGTYSINAWDPGPPCLLVDACGTACTIYGTAQLTCP